ncbi:MAG: hypothetical protein SGI88_20650 [Candidatus Hydrogenedentes bacterium]|nr:hypothetical protein [Candidatus Hydrogenedentota bacterium]
MKMPLSKAVTAVSVLLCFMHAAFAATGDEIGVELVKAIEQEFSQPHFNEEGAEKFARKFGIEAVPSLLNLLQSEDVKIPKGKVAVYLGKVGDRRAIAPLKKFVECSLQQEISTSRYLDLCFALHALAFIGTDECLSYLRQGIRYEFWHALNDAFTVPELRLDHESAVQAMREASLRAYATSGKESVLNDLTANRSDFDTFENVYPEALQKVRDRVSRDGR